MKHRAKDVNLFPGQETGNEAYYRIAWSPPRHARADTGLPNSLKKLLGYADNTVLPHHLLAILPRTRCCRQYSEPPVTSA